MNTRIQNVTETLETVGFFGGAHALVPPNARAQILYTTIATIVIALRTHSTGQDSGNAGYHSGTSTRRDAANDVLAQMRPINKMARALRRAEFPGVRELFRMPTSRSYAAIVSRAESFLEAIGPIKATFVERGLPADFDEQLAEALADIPSGSQTRSMGKVEQVGGTTGMDAKASEGLEYLAELDSILSYLYRNDPVLLAEWKTARHVKRDPVRKKEDEEAQPGASSSGAGGGGPAVG